MKEPRCTSVVPFKNLWEIAMEFMGRIDEKLIEFNLVYAYITYLISKIERIPRKNISRLVFLSCFDEIGKLYSGSDNSSPLIETYLFLKYFSPVKNFAEILLNEEKGKLTPFNVLGVTHAMCKEYTKYLLEYNDKNKAYEKILEDKKKYTFVDINALGVLVNKVDFFYEIHSLHYKTIVYKYINRTIFNGKEKDKFFTMLSSLFEMYSVQTLYHSKLTAYIAYIIAKKMYLPNDRCKKLYVAGLSHDLGKVCIPLKILEKPDKLTDKEYSIMKKHVEYTKEILKNKMDYDVIEIAYRHHEKMDGSGYPNKLTKDYLTIDQKILQVSDIISALIAKRSYKEAWSINKTIEILDNDVNNNKLDKEVVDVFKKYQAKILKYTSESTNQADKIYKKLNKEREVLLEKMK